VISIDGKTRREGSTLAQVVAGRHFGPGSEWNGTPVTPRQTPQTAERAIIVSAGHPNIQTVIIMTHCDWLVTHMDDKVWDWSAHRFPAEGHLPKGVSQEDYRLTHRNF
jgi:hypothetical protein